MANPAVAENTANQSAPAPKKGRKLLLFIVFGLLLMIGAGGGYYYLQQSKASAQNKPERDRRTRADEETKDGEPADAEERAAKSKTDSRTPDLGLPDDSAVKQVIELQPFIVNLADKDEARYLRLTLSLGLDAEPAEEKPNPLFITRLRNVLLAVLTSRTSDEVLTLEGKAKLRKDLLRAARAASTEPRIEAIYITEFIVQL